MPNIDNRLTVRLSRTEQEILSQLFNYCAKIIVLQQFTSGLSGSKVFLVRPILDGDRAELSTVVKIDDVYRMDAEWDAYKSHIANRLPNEIPMDNEPVNPRGSNKAGARYRFAGGKVYAIESLYQILEDSPPDLIVKVIAHLGEGLRALWQDRRQRPEFYYRDAYDNIMPANFEMTYDETAAGGTWLTPNDRRMVTLNLSDSISVFGFTIIKRSEANGWLMCSVAQKNESFRFYIRGLEGVPWVWNDLRVGDELTRPLHGHITQTRLATLKAKIDDLSIEDLDLSQLAEPLSALEKQLSISRDIQVASIHGDLNLQNVLVQPENQTTHVIDFAQAREDYILRDWLHLEMHILTTFLAEACKERQIPTSALFHFLTAVHCAATDKNTIALKSPWNHESFQRPFTALVTIRQQVRPLLTKTDDWSEYYQGLYFYLLGSLKFKTLTDHPAHPYPAQVAYYGAAVALHFATTPPQTSDGIQEEIAGSSHNQRENVTIINTGGGAYIGGNVSTGGGAFIGRDQHTTERPSRAKRTLKTATIRKLLAKHFSLLELKALCNELDFNYENFPHSRVGELALELVAECRRKQKLEQLADLIPDEYWPTE